MKLKKTLVVGCEGSIRTVNDPLDFSMMLQISQMDFTAIILKDWGNHKARNMINSVRKLMIMDKTLQTVGDSG